MIKTAPSLVTGASGFIGKSTIRALLALAPNSPILSAGRSGGCSISFDLCATNIVVPEGIDTILHLAGEKRDESRMWTVNHEGTCKLVEAAARAGVRRFVYLSSVGVYGAPMHAGLVDEHHARTPGNAYEASKNAGEACVRALCSRLGVEHVVVQPTNVIGHIPGQSYPLLGLMSMVKAGRFAYFGKNETWVNYIHVDDVAVAIAAAAQSGRVGGIYIANTPARLTDLVGWICDELAIAPPQRRLSAALGKVAATAGGSLQRLTGRSMPFNPERYTELTNTTQYDGQRITQDLGLRYPIGIEQAVRSLVHAYRKEGRL